jgi:hypothetical protein
MKGQDGPPNSSGSLADDNYYNPVFERLMAAQSGLLTGAIAYSIYKVAKREWVEDFRKVHGRRPTETEFRSHTAAQTDAILHGCVARADQILGQYAQNVVNDAKPKITEEALRGTFWRSVWPSLAASVIFAGVLALLFLIAAIMGVGLPIEIAAPPSG